ncbi:hypothetical protein [Bacillus sp. lyk4-R2A-2]|uniref:hypothetical protein n=1 Tax=Bacillus sp. lyk4-R2A-2 TaxID=3040282 RepID=UPI00254D5974|nr:hypothetical protein [Bacillus sp. lyk4-R2A-2]
MLNFFEFIAIVAKRVWGFNPNRDVKPVHFANGFFRSISGGSNNIGLLQKAAAGYLKGSTDVSNKQFLVDIRDSFIKEENDETELLEKVGDLRSALDLLLNQDKALFGNFTPTATLSHFLQTSSDPSDNGTGKFIAEVLTGIEDGEVIRSLRESLKDNKDNLFLLTSPLLLKKEMGAEPFVSDQINAMLQESPYLKSIQSAFSNLITYKNRLDKTVFLQRIVTLGCFAIYLHLTNRSMDKANIEQKGLAPIFLSSAEPSMEIREVSRASFSRGRQRIEIGYEEGLLQEIYDRWGIVSSKEEYIEIIKSLLPNLDPTPTQMNQDTLIWHRFIDDFEGNLLGTSNIEEAFSKAFVRTAFSFFNQGKSNKSNPESLCLFIGKNIGLVYPREKGRGDKYYLPGPRFLDTLVVSLLGPDKEVSIEEFWDRAWNSYGIIVGARGTKDTQILSNWGIRQVSPKQASQNAKKINSELVRMGYVTEYADDIAMIRGGGVLNE